MFDKIKRKRERKNKLDSHEYEEYFLTDEQIGQQQEMNAMADALVQFAMGFMLTANEVVEAFTPLMAGINAVVAYPETKLIGMLPDSKDEKELAR